MKIVVTDDAGSVMYESDTLSMYGVRPAEHERAKVALALRDAAVGLATGRLPPAPNLPDQGR